MSWSTSERKAFVATLDGVDQVVSRFYRLLIVIIIGAVTGFAGWIYVKRPWGDGHQGEWFYFSGAVLLVMGWACSQLWTVNRRLRRLETRSDCWETSSSEQVPTRSWEFRLGNDSENDGQGKIRLQISQDVQLPFGALAGNIVPDEQLLRRAASEIEHGASMEQACRSIQPEFESWNSLQRYAYVQLVTTLLKQRQQQ